MFADTVDFEKDFGFKPTTSNKEGLTRFSQLILQSKIKGLENASMYKRLYKTLYS